jgi:hypothetical protein
MRRRVQNVCVSTWKPDETGRKLIMNSILYTTLKLMFIHLPLFVPHTNPHSEPIRQHMTLPPPPHYVTYSSALPATHFPCRMTTQTCQRTHSRACLRRQHVYLLSSAIFSTCFVLSAGACSRTHGYIFRTFHFSLFTWDLLL